MGSAAVVELSVPIGFVDRLANAVREAGGKVEVVTSGRKLADVRENPRVALAVEDDAWTDNTLVRIDVGSASHRTYD